MAKVFYKASVERDLKKLDRAMAARLLAKLERTFAVHPDAGQPLRGEFQGLFRYRVGDYRIVYTKVPDGVLVLRIGHRREVYR